MRMPVQSAPGICKQVVVANLGTSAVALLVEEAEVLGNKPLRNVCGQAENSIVPGLVGVETGQAAFGDVYSWLSKLISWQSQGEKNDIILQRLEKEAAQIPENSEFPIALDWFNGRRYPNTDDTQRSVIKGISLSTTAPVLYRSLVFSTICGFKRIIDALEAGGIRINTIIAVGGISQKSEYIMQMLTDVLNRTVMVSATTQTCALGAAIYAAVGAGIYESIPSAQKKMCPDYTKAYQSNKNKAQFYQSKYNKYLQLAKLLEQSLPVH